MLEHVYLKHGQKLLLRDAHPLSVRAVDDKHDSVRVRVVASPIRPDACLPTQIPHLRTYATVFREGGLG